MTRQLHLYGKRTFLLLLVVLMLMYLPGCIEQENAGGILVADPSLTEISEKGAMSIYKAELREPFMYYDEFAALMLQESSIVKQERELDYLHIITADNSIFHMSTSAGVFWDKPIWSYIEGAFAYAEGRYISQDDDKLYYAKDDDLPFMTRAQAEEEVIEKLRFYFDSPFDISVAETYVLDYLSLRDREQEKLDKGLQEDLRTEEVIRKEEWSMADDCYFIVLNISLDDIHMMAEDYFPSHYTTNRGCRVEVCYGADGFRHLLISPQYSLTVDQSNIDLVGYEETLKSVKQKCDNVILPTETIIQDMKQLYMVCQENYSDTGMRRRVLPIWRVQLQSTDGTNPAIFYFDAQSGREII